MRLLVFAYHSLTSSLPCPCTSLTIYYISRIDSRMRREPFRDCCWLNAGSSLIAYHFLTHSPPFGTCPELTARCEGSRFWVAAVCMPDPYQLLTMCLQFPHHSIHAQHSQQDARGAVLGLLFFAYHFLTNCLPCSGVLRCCWSSVGVAGDPEDVFKRLPTALRDHGPRFAFQNKVQNEDGIHSTH